MADEEAGTGELVISSTTTEKHPRLQELNVKVHESLVSFDEIPQEYQMDALDIIQGMVNQVMQKITNGRIMAVKFVPVEKEETQINHVEVKQETIELDSSPPSPASLPGLCDDEKNGQQNSIPPNPLGTIEIHQQPPADQPSAPSLQMSPAVCVVKQEDMDEPPIMHSSPQSTPKRRGRKRKANKEIPPVQSKTSSIKRSPSSKVSSASSSSMSSQSLKTPESNRRKSSRKRKANKDKSPAAEIVGPAKSIQSEDSNKSTEKSTSDTSKSEQESSSIISRLNGPLLLSPIKDFKTTEEIRAMFPEEVFNPKKVGPFKKNVSVTRRHKCDQCPYSTDKKDHMAVHMVTHSKEKKFHCELCDKDFTAAASLKRHLQIHDGQKDFECPICHKLFYTVNCLRQHAPKHTGEKLFQCDQCDKSYTLACNLRRHKRVHTGEMPYKCDLCHVSFRDYSSLKFHKLKHSGEKPYACDVCDKRFRTSSDIIRHKRIHSDKKDYTCDECGRAFTQKATLVAHKKTHTDVKPWMCELCSKCFRTKSAYQHHLRWHAGVKPYQCLICKKSFTTKTYLANHQVIHTKEKPFPCRFCNIKFNQRSNRERHERIHSNKRKYKCRFCDKAFKYGNALSYHEGIHTGVKEVCEKCGLAFRSKKTLSKHMATCDASGKIRRAPRSLMKEFNKAAEIKMSKPANLLQKISTSPLRKGKLLKPPISPIKIRLANVKNAKHTKAATSPKKNTNRKVKSSGKVIDIPVKEARVCLKKIDVGARKAATVGPTKRRGRPPKSIPRLVIPQNSPQSQVLDIKQEPQDSEMQKINTEDGAVIQDLSQASQIENVNCTGDDIKQEPVNVADQADTSQEIDVDGLNGTQDTSASEQIEYHVSVNDELDPICSSQNSTASFGDANGDIDMPGAEKNVQNKNSDGNCVNETTNQEQNCVSDGNDNGINGVL